MSSTPIKSSSAATCAEVRQPANIATFPVRDYDLASTLGSGQAFRWRCQDGGWNGVIAGRWVRLRADEFSICAETAGPQAQLHNAPGAPVSDPASFQSHPATRRIGDRRSAVSFGSRAVSRCVVEPASDWNWLTDYLQCDLDLSAILQTFPDDEPMRAAVNACRGLRLLRQEPWECLASFILSSTKQIVQIQQIVALLSERFGEPIPTFPPYGPAFAFPTPERIARATEAELRGCKMGFRAPYLLETARTIASGKLNLEQLREVPVEIAREALMLLPGVGRKIADCVLLFAYGFPTAFPVDVWVMKALRQLYFPKRRPSAKQLLRFSETHFGANAGYAQQYLFHYMRTKYDLK